MAITVYENGVLIWYDTAHELDGVLRRAANLATFHPQDPAIQQLSADAQKVRAEINTAIENKWSAIAAKHQAAKGKVV